MSAGALSLDRSTTWASLLQHLAKPSPQTSPSPHPKNSPPPTSTHYFLTAQLVSPSPSSPTLTSSPRHRGTRVPASTRARP